MRNNKKNSADLLKFNPDKAHPMEGPLPCGQEPFFVEMVDNMCRNKRANAEPSTEVCCTKITPSVSGRKVRKQACRFTSIQGLLSCMDSTLDSLLRDKPEKFVLDKLNLLKDDVDTLRTVIGH